MACEFDHPDCLNCPYEDCTATSQDIIRQWKLTNGLRRMDDPDSVPTKTSKYLTKQQRYELSEKGKAARRRYNSSEKGKERMKQYNQSDQGKARQKRYAQSEKGRATKRRYYLKKKLEREQQDMIGIEVS